MDSVRQYTELMGKTFVEVKNNNDEELVFIADNGDIQQNKDKLDAYLDTLHHYIRRLYDV